MKKVIMMLVALTATLCANAKIFTVENPDKVQSPYTGMTREHWKQAAQYLLEGPFSYVNNIADPMNLPKQEGKSYPRNESEVPTSRLEAMCRTMFLAGPLLKENPDLTLHGIKVGEYYRYQMASFLDKESPLYLPPKTWRGNGGQKLVELGGLAVSLLMAPEVFWTPMPKDTRDALAAVFKTYAEGETIDMNWRFFNMCLLSFLHGQGYDVNTKYLEELLHKNLNAYVGDGWYHDAPLFDYYSMWAFQMYGPLWAESYGKKYYPTEARQFLQNLNEIPKQYPYMFGRDGKIQMWGRSITYRMGAAIPLALTGLLKSNDIDYGWMRRICSGAVLQFLQNPDFMAEDGLPNLGFYGHFEACLQHYSCRGSVFWMAKMFLALYMPKDNPFWTATETEGSWKDMKAGTPNIIYAPAPKTMTVNYAETGMSEFRNVFTRNSGFYYGLENYDRFAYNSSLPWQTDGKNGEVSMSYVTATPADLSKGEETKWRQINSYTGEGLCKDGWFRRKAEMENDRDVTITMAEKPFGCGMLRIDEVSTKGERNVRMGFYALPKLNGAIKEKTVKLAGGRTAMIIDNGQYQVATVMLDGWDRMEFVHCEGLHPEAAQSTVVNLTAKLNGKRILRTLLLMKRSGETMNIEKEMARLKGKSFSVTISNPMTTSREAGEMVELDAATVAAKLSCSTADVATARVMNGSSILPSQLTHDGKLIFQRPAMNAKQSITLKIVTDIAAAIETSSDLHQGEQIILAGSAGRMVFGRVFKERQEDFSFENDRLAYRFYGPDTQRRGEKLYGYDVFNKRTSEMVLEEFYAGQCDNQMWNTVNKLRRLGKGDLADDVYNAGFSYHVDHGKGMDCYKVGSTLGAGTNALITKDGKITFPWCYRKVEVLDNGPLRLTVKLTYEKETRILTVDAGSSMVKAVVTYENGGDADFCAGIAVHKENPKAYSIDKVNGIIAYEDLGDSEFYLPRLREKLNKEMGSIFIGCVVPDASDCRYAAFAKETSGAPGQVIAVAPRNESNTYYFGNAWSRNTALGIDTMMKWNTYLGAFAQQLKAPLQIKMK